MGILKIIKEAKKSYICEISCDFCEKQFIRRVSKQISTNIYCSFLCKVNAPYNYVWTDERRKEYSERFSGGKNPNYNNRWSDEQRLKASNMMKQSYIDDPDKAYKSGASNRGKKFSKERIEKMHSNRSRDSYCGRHPSEETRKLIGEKSKEKWTPEYKEQHRKKLEDLGYWVPLSEMSEFKKYNKLSNWTCDMVEFFTEDELSNHKLFGTFNSKNSKGYVRDHIVSRYIGFSNNIPYKIIRHPCNMRYIKHSENVTKGFDDKKLLDFEIVYMIKCLINRIKNFELVWVEHDECLDIIKKELSIYEN